METANSASYMMLQGVRRQQQQHEDAAGAVYPRMRRVVTPKLERWINEVRIRPRLCCAFACRSCQPLPNAVFRVLSPPHPPFPHAHAHALGIAFLNCQRCLTLLVASETSSHPSSLRLASSRCLATGPVLTMWLVSWTWTYR